MEAFANPLIPLAFTAAFTAWAGVVAYGVRGIRADLKQISENLRKESEKLNEYIVKTEARLAVVEDRLRNNGIK